MRCFFKHLTDCSLSSDGSNGQYEVGLQRIEKKRRKGKNMTSGVL